LTQIFTYTSDTFEMQSNELKRF